MARFNLTSQKFQLSENDVEKQCLDLLWARGYYPVRVAAGRYIMPDREVLEACRKCGVTPRWQTVAEPGFPDYVIPGWCMEVKRPGGKLSTEQQLKIMDLERTRNIPCPVVESLDGLIDWLAHHPKL